MYAPHVTNSQRSTAAAKAEILGFAHHPYLLDSAGPVSYDCSGLAMTAWLGALNLPHNADQMSQLTGIAPLSDAGRLQPGDLVYYEPEADSLHPQHVAVYLYKRGGLHIVAQATDPEHGSEVIRMHKYVEPLGFGFIGHI